MFFQKIRENKADRKSKYFIKYEQEAIASCFLTKNMKCCKMVYRFFRGEIR